MIRPVSGFLLRKAFEGSSRIPRVGLTCGRVVVRYPVQLNARKG